MTCLEVAVAGSEKNGVEWIARALVARLTPDLFMSLKHIGDTDESVPYRSGSFDDDEWLLVAQPAGGDPGRVRLLANFGPKPRPEVHHVKTHGGLRALYHACLLHQAATGTDEVRADAAEKLLKLKASDAHGGD